MKPHRVFLAAAVTAMLLAATNAHAAGAEKSQEPQSFATRPPRAAGAKAPLYTNRVRLLQEEVIEDEPVNHLAHASEVLNQHEANVVASELPKTAFLVKADAACAEGAVRPDLHAAAKFENLDGRVGKGVVESQDNKEKGPV